jgi:hypothetical protein
LGVSSDFDPNLANKELILLRLRELSSRSEQERLWFTDWGEGRDMSSFTEAVCGLFDDSAFDAFIDERRPTGLGAAADSALLELSAFLDTIDDEPPFESKEMEAVRHLAAVALGLIEST